ncbi:hypothetical protein [Candidatus Nitrosocaldus islandicus]|uniref:hypothetical protein n=1 Tax=Candidatus Nitrosocaldus islandicus TaxID=2045011 RepID=UPI000CD1D28F|nr:hypothetical protein [Candidatus Nitrosocaldus islandicus]
MMVEKDKIKNTIVIPSIYDDRVKLARYNDELYLIKGRLDKDEINADDIIPVNSMEELYAITLRENLRNPINYFRLALIIRGYPRLKNILTEELKEIISIADKLPASLLEELSKLLEDKSDGSKEVVISANIIYMINKCLEYLKRSNINEPEKELLDAVKRCIVKTDRILEFPTPSRFNAEIETLLEIRELIESKDAKRGKDKDKEIVATVPTDSPVETTLLPAEGLPDVRVREPTVDELPITNGQEDSITVTVAVSDELSRSLALDRIKNSNASIVRLILILEREVALRLLESIKV